MEEGRILWEEEHEGGGGLTAHMCVHKLGALSSPLASRTRTIPAAFVSVTTACVF